MPGDRGYWSSLKTTETRVVPSTGVPSCMAGLKCARFTPAMAARSRLAEPEEEASDTSSALPDAETRTVNSTVPSSPLERASDG